MYIDIYNTFNSVLTRHGLTRCEQCKYLKAHKSYSTQSIPHSLVHYHIGMSTDHVQG